LWAAVGEAVRPEAERWWMAAVHQTLVGSLEFGSIQADEMGWPQPNLPPWNGNRVARGRTWWRRDVVAQGWEAAAGVVRGGGGTREEDMTVREALWFSTVDRLRQILPEPSEGEKRSGSVHLTCTCVLKTFSSYFLRGAFSTFQWDSRVLWSIFNLKIISRLPKKQLSI
jgi:hypothetical protein